MKNPTPPRSFFRFLSWLGNHEVAVIVAVGIIAAGIWGFALLADEVMEGGTGAFDRKVLLSMRTGSDLAPVGPPTFQEAARDVTALGGVTVLSLITLMSAGFLALAGKNRMAIFVCGAILSGVAVCTLLKDLFHRPRPEIVPHAMYVSSSSFPSGHSMMSAVVYLTLAALLARSQERKPLKAYFVLIAAFLIMIVGVSRVYLGVHWPTDVLAGWTTGAIWAILCWLVARRLQRQNKLEHASETAPSVG